MMTSLFLSLLAIFCIGTASIMLAAVLSFSILSKTIELMISLSVGMMLSTALLHALPEAFERFHSPDQLFLTLLIGLLAFFLLEKGAILRHSHHHEGDGHHHEKGFDRHEAGPEGWMILIGHSFHSFTDGILISAAFLTNFYLGLITSLAIFAHEIPQQIGDFIVMLNAGLTRKRTFLYSLCTMIISIMGALIGFITLRHVQTWIPYVLTLASAGFIYIALSDLIPQMQRHSTVRETIPQIALVSLGIAIIFILTHSLHASC